MLDDRAIVTPDDVTVLSNMVRTEAPQTSADAYRALPAVLASGDDTEAAIHARIDLALLSAREGLVESALYQIDELTKDARRVRDLVADANGEPGAGAGPAGGTGPSADPAAGAADPEGASTDCIVTRADAARDAIEGAASRVTHPGR